MTSHPTPLHLAIALVAALGLPALAADPARAPRPSAGQWHGAASVSPEVLARFAPRPISPDLSRAVRAMLDVPSTGLGVPTRDGQRLFFGWQVTGVPQVWRLDGPDRFPVQLTAGEDATTLAGVTPDGQTLVVQRVRTGEESPSLYLLSAQGGPLRPVWHEAGIQTTAPRLSGDGRFLYFRSSDGRPDASAIHRYELASGKTELLLEAPGLWSVEDERPDGRLLLCRETGSKSTEWSEWAPSTRQLRPLLGQGEAVEYRVSYGAAEGELLVVTGKIGEYRRLYRWSAGQLTPISRELRWDVQVASIDPARRRIVYTVNEAGYQRLSALDARTFRPLAVPEWLSWDHQVSLGASSSDGRYLTIGIDTGTAPLATWVLDWETGTLSRWVAPGAPEVDLLGLVRAEQTSYPARDGTRIPAWVRRPATCPSGPCPVVVEFHDGPEAQAMPGFSARAELYVDAGFVLVQPNVRGSDGYGKSWLAADDGPKRLGVITDIEDAATWARQAFARDGVTPRVGITGVSYGGYLALMGMTMFAGAYDAGASVAGMANLVTFLENTAPSRRLPCIREYGDPVTDREALLKLSPTSHVERVRAPLLVQQGASDPRLPVGEALRIHDALVARGVPVQLVFFADDGHGAQARENQVLMLGKIIEFFREQLHPTAAPPRGAQRWPRQLRTKRRKSQPDQDPGRR